MTKQLTELQRFPCTEAFGQPIMELSCLAGKLAKKNQTTIGNEDQNPPAVFVINDSVYLSLIHI